MARRYRAIFLLAILMAAAAGVAVGDVGADDEIAQLWRTPVFRREFMGSYGMKAEVEPRVSATERVVMANVAVLMGSKGGMEKARQLLEKAITADSTAVFDFTLASIYLQEDKLDAAARWYQKAVLKFPSFLRAHRNLGLVQIRKNVYDKAVAPLAKAIELGDVSGLTFGLLGFAYLQTEEYTAAEGAYRQAMLLQPDVPDWKLGLSRVLFKELKFEEAATLCGNLIRKEPARVDYWMLQSGAYLGMKQPLKAAQNYEALDSAGLATAGTLNTLGDIYVNEGVFDLAASAYLRAMDRDEQGSSDRYLRDAEVLAARGAGEEAARLVERVKTRMGKQIGDAERKRLLKLDARLAATRASGGDEQRRLLEEIVALDPLDGEALILLGQYHAGAGNSEKACFLYERAAGLEKFEAEAKLRMAQCMVRNGRYKEAVPLLKRALELKPREDVSRYLEQVERVARTKS